MQLERTNLAWRRAAASLLGLGFATPKVAWAALGGWSLLATLVVVVGAAVLLAVSHRRYGAFHDALTQDAEPVTLDGRLAAFTAGLIMAISFFGAYLVLITAQGALNHV